MTHFVQKGPTCQGFALANVLERGHNISLTAKDVYKFYEDAGLDVNDAQSLRRTLDANVVTPMGGKKISSAMPVWATGSNKFTKMSMRQIWDAIDPKKCYIFSIHTFKDEKGRQVLPGTIDWPKESYPQSGSHAVAFVDKKGDYIRGSIIFENSWKKQHIFELKAKNFKREIKQIWEIVL